MQRRDSLNITGSNGTAAGTEMSLPEKMQIIDTNLSRLDADAADLAEMREAQLAEKSRAFLSVLPGDSASEVSERLIRNERFPDAFRQMTDRTFVPEPGRMLPELLQKRFAVENRLEQISLCASLAHAGDARYHADGISPDEVRMRVISDLIREEYPAEDDSAPDLDVRTPRHAGERIAYLKNTYTDEAYAHFAEVLPHAAVAYYSDFPGICEAVYYGRASACILPMENSEDGKLQRFYTLSAKYDLRISYVCDVTAEETDVTTRYGLLRRTLTVPEPEDASPFSRYLECRVIFGDGITLQDVLLAASVYGLTLTRADAAPDGYAGGEFAYDLIFCIGDGDEQAMLVFLYLMAPQFTLLGLYASV